MYEERKQSLIRGIEREKAELEMARTLIYLSCSQLKRLLTSRGRGLLGEAYG